MFKNAIAFQVHGEKPDVNTLEMSLDALAIQPIRAREAQRFGWAPVFEADDPSLTYHAEASGITLFVMESQQRQLPGYVVKDEVEKRADQIFRETGMPAGRSQRRLLKEQVYEELLPRAFVKRTQTMIAWVQGMGINWLIVDASSRKVAESALDLLRLSLGSLKVAPLRPGDNSASPRGVMTQAVHKPDTILPADVRLGDSCKMTDPTDSSRKITFKDTGLEIPEVTEALSYGAKVTEVELNFEGSAKFTLTDELTFKRLSFTDDLIEESREADEPRMTGYLLSVHALLSVIVGVLDLHKVQQ